MSEATTHHHAGGMLSAAHVGYGVAGGLVGGLVFGTLMHTMGMIEMVAMLLGSESVAVGWLVHLAISAFIGATFAVLLGWLVHGIGTAVLAGTAYGVVWWVLGALLLMPTRLGMGAFELNTTAWQSLMGHLVYGLLLGTTFGILVRREHR